ncbi:MAG TPA: hypothetical protein VFI22_18735, partial [Thermomicrobiales bacterium]|nr:hypothetical protein [Thermomicrobiales bacterium]
MSEDGGWSRGRVMGRPRRAGTVAPAPNGAANLPTNGHARGDDTAPAEPAAGACPGLGTARGIVSGATPFRQIGDAPGEIWEREAARRGSPIDDLDGCIAACRGFGALALAQAIRETSLGRDGAADRRNALGLMGPDGRTLLRFERWAEGFAAYRRRLADPAYKDGVYGPADLALAEFVAIYVGGPGCRASGLERCANGETRASVTDYLNDVISLVNGWRANDAVEAAVGTTPADPPPARAGGREPPAVVDRIIPPGLNTAWDDLGPRTIRGVCLHRMLGTLEGTDAWFRGGARASARTDFGIGDGRIFQWTPLRGRMAPWASGPANDVEGDGVAFIRRYGIAAVN